MENRPASLRSRRVCRFCLTESVPLSFIYERDHSKPFQVPLTLQIMSCVAIEVYAADGMPQMICATCRWNLDRSYKFKLQCKKADEALRAYPVTGVLPRPFPPLPNNPSELNTKRLPEQRSQNEQTKKPRVEEGERDRRDQRERERERDRQPEKQTDNTDHDIYEDEQDGGSEGENENQNEKDARKLEPGEIRVHACDQCDRTFPLKQALQLHIQRAHRDKNYKCTECDKLFFTKYDLTKHVATHSEEKPFTCQICHKHFARISLLQRHEKIHREELRYGCQHCDREFFTTDELEKHEAMVHKAVKPYQCNICNKRFTYRQGLERHELLHSDDKSFVCEYCKEAFRSSTKLARHLSTHAGHRPYLCKLCPRSFLLSHHLTRHMRTHSVEKPHVCEECGKAFKRKESLEVHQLTHAKRGMGLTCEICQESCRNRADYVTHIKQHIEAGEKMGPDGLRPDTRKEKIDSESEEEEEEEDDSDGDDDYEPPAYVAKKIPKNEPPESDEEMEKSDRKEQVVYVRSKDGNLLKKTIKTLMPIHRREIQDNKGRSTPSGSQSSKITPGKSEGRSVGSDNDSTPKLRSQHRVDETEAQVQKIVASVFKEHKIPLKHQNIPQDQSTKDSSNSANHSQTCSQQSTPVAASNQSSSNTAAGQTSQDDTQKSETTTLTPKSVNTFKVIKRIVGKPVSSEGAQALASSIKNESTGTPSSGTKITRRVIVRRIIKQGDTTREVILNPDGTMLDPAELAKLPTRNVVKRVVVKQPKDKLRFQGQAGDQQSVVLTAGTSESNLTDSPKFELKTLQSATSTSQSDTKPSSPTQKQSEGVKSIQKGSETPVTSTDGNEENQESTIEKLEKLEKRVEQQRLKIEELQARKQQETEAVEDMLPERQDESEEEQQLPLKRVFVKRKQCVYDEEKEYDSDEKEPPPVKKEEPIEEYVPTQELIKKEHKKPVVTSTSKVYGNKKIILVKSENPVHLDDSSMSQELSNILDSTENVVKMQENVLSNLSQISALDGSVELKHEVLDVTNDEPMEVSAGNIDEEMKSTEDKTRESLLEDLQAGDKSEDEIINAHDEGGEPMEIQIIRQNVANNESQPDSSLSLDGKEITNETEEFVASESELNNRKVEVSPANDSIIELSSDTINLNDANETQDSIEDKLSQLDS